MIHVIGMGPGAPAYITDDAKQTIQGLKTVIGVKRQIDTVRSFMAQDTKAHAYSGRLNDLKDLIDQRDFLNEDLGILASGDPSFYGITEWVKRTYGTHNIIVHPGISSSQILFSKAKVAMHDFFMTSLHGRSEALEILSTYDKLCLLTDKHYSPSFIANYYVERGENPRMIIGENLSYEDEIITDALASDIEAREYKMSVVIVINER